jgi:lysophospholipase L1-like esterase
MIPQRGQKRFALYMNWYEDEVSRVEQEASKLDYLPETVFYGSSSITLWTTLYHDFVDRKPVNLGFGGSTLAACSWFFDRVVTPVQSAKSMVIYAGDNDLGDGRNPEEVCLFYRLLMSQIRANFGNIPSYFISIKPSISRWEIIGKIRTANRLIMEETTKYPLQNYIDIFPHMLNSQGVPVKQFFEADGLHLSAEGYALWTKIIRDRIGSSDKKNAC